MSGEWTEVIPGVWRHTYFTKTGIECNAHALRLADGGVAVLSPPAGAGDAMYAATEALGPVRALVAPNTGHDLGQVAWQARYPDAACFAPEVAAAAIQKAKPGCRALRPLSELGPLLAEGARVVDVPATSSGMTMFSAGVDGKRALFLDELINHEPAMPAMFRFMFWVTGSRGGVALTRFWTWMFTRDKRAVAAAVLAEFDARPPTVVLMSHGAPVTDVAAVRAQVARIA